MYKTGDAYLTFKSDTEAGLEFRRQIHQDQSYKLCKLHAIPLE